jgi:hypothetical protein
MKRSFPVVFFLLVLLISACAPVTPGPQETEVAPRPTVVQGSHPLTTRTGNEEIDHILAAIANGDVEMLRSLIKFTTAECMQLEGLGGPPKCQEGEAEGTLVEVLPSIGSEGSFPRKAEIENWPGVEVSGLYAIYEVSPAVVAEQYYPIGKYAILFVSEENHPAISLRVDNGGIVRVDYLFDTSPDALKDVIERESAQVILAPPT